MSRFAVFAVPAVGPEGVVAILSSAAEATRVCELLDGPPQYDYRVAEYHPDLDVLHEDAVELLAACHYYANEFPCYFDTQITVEDLSLLDRALHIIAPFGSDTSSNTIPF